MDIHSLVANVLKICKYLICAYYTKQHNFNLHDNFNWNIDEYHTIR